MTLDLMISADIDSSLSQLDWDKGGEGGARRGEHGKVGTWSQVNRRAPMWSQHVPAAAANLVGQQ